MHEGDDVLNVEARHGRCVADFAVEGGVFDVDVAVQCGGDVVVEREFAVGVAGVDFFGLHAAQVVEVHHLFQGGVCAVVEKHRAAVDVAQGWGEEHTAVLFLAGQILADGAA